MAYLLAIDVGSTNLKAVLFDERGVVIAKGDTPTQLSRPGPDHPDWAVWTPEQIWSGIAESVKCVTAKIDASEIKGVAVTGMGMDGVPMDRDGNSLYPFISRHCPRTVPQQEWWIEHIGDEKQFEPPPARSLSRPVAVRSRPTQKQFPFRKKEARFGM